MRFDDVFEVDYRGFFLVLACLVYGVFGSPTPDHLGFFEVVVGACLVLSVGIASPVLLFFSGALYPAWARMGGVFLIYGLSVPVLVAAMHGHGLGAILRDIVPFIFLFLPVFLLPMMRYNMRAVRLFLWGFVFIGLVFAARSLYMRFGSGEALLYLENMPSVLFACLFLIGCAMRCVFEGVSVGRVAVFCVLIALSVIPILAMGLTLQRASLGAVFVYVCVVFGWFFVRSPARALNIIVLGGVILCVAIFSFDDVFLSLQDKTRKVGFNNRSQEFSAVWEVVCANPVTFFFGLGWGGQFHSPAVGGLSVNFTHNFFSYFLLKSGISGVLCAIAYIAGLLEQLMRVVLGDPVLGLALLAPILIDISLYASFKSLDFGFGLLMILGALLYSDYSESNDV